MCEAGMFPGVLLQMVYWYRPDEMSIRLLYFYALGNFSQVISGVLAYAFDTISGRDGLSGWQWYDRLISLGILADADRLFLVEGVITIAYGVALFFILPDCECTLFDNSAHLTNWQFPNKRSGSRRRRKLSFKHVYRVMLLELKSSTSTSAKSLSH